MKECGRSPRERGAAALGASLQAAARPCASAQAATAGARRGGSSRQEGRGAAQVPPRRHEGLHRPASEAAPEAPAAPRPTMKEEAGHPEEARGAAPGGRRGSARGTGHHAPYDEG
eukprot:9998024-Alexandrium_andersonii.AAC.1